MAKKIKKKSNKKNTNIKLNENFWALIMIIIGIIIYIIVSMPNIGFVGKFVKMLILSLFSNFSYIIAFTLIILGSYKLIFYKTYTFKKLNKIDTTVFFIMLLFLYSSMNTVQLQNNSAINIESLKNVAIDGQNYSGLGIICYLISFLFYKMIGKTGIILFVILGVLYLAVKYQKNQIINIINFIRNTLKNQTEKRNTVNKQTEKLDSVSKKQDLSDKVDINIISDYFDDAPDYKDIVKKEKEILKYDINEDFDDTVSSENSNIDFKYENEFSDEKEELDYVDNQEKEEIADQIKNLNIRKIQVEDMTNQQDMQKSLGITKTDDIKLDNIEVKPYKKPKISLLNDYKKVQVQDKEEKLQKAQVLKQTLASFGVEANVENISVGPTITRYELKPKVGTKVSKITNLTEDLALALAAKAIRIEAPIPGKPFIGVEVPNEVAQTVSFKEVIKTCINEKDKYKIVFAMGKDISGKVILSDITKMPHTLIAGSTGSGKSVCINTLICSILYNYSPQEVKLILIDPKVVELSIYNKIPHLIIPVVTDMKKTPQALSWAVNEMEKRYALFAENKSKDIDSYNQKIEEKLPRIVIVIDELADLMMVAPKEIEESIARLAQKARACGIHLIVATQRPSVDVITGLIKANVPSRIAFAVSSQTDSRTILDSGGAEKLLGKGDMLYSPIGMNKPMRIQGAFLTEEEVEKITQYIEINNQVEDLKQKQEEVSKEIDEIVVLTDKKENSDDELYEKVVEFAIENEEISVSLVQRQFRIGYNRASRIVEDMEKNGIVSKSDGSKPRKVIKN